MTTWSRRVVGVAVCLGALLQGGAARSQSVPDLVAEVSSPPSAYPWGAFEAAVRICNVGAASAPSADFDLYLSDDDLITVDDLLIGGGLFGDLDPGACVTVDVDGYSLELGVHHLGPIVDPYDVVLESDEQNNSGAGAAFGIGWDADFVVASVDAPSSASSGISMGVPVTICNRGTTVGMPTVELYLSTDSEIDPADEPISFSDPFDWLEPGACATRPVLTWISAQDGEYWIGALADPLDLSPELVESNNASAASPIGIGWDPDFVVSIVRGPPSATTGSAFEARVTVCNRGLGGMSDVGLFLSADDHIDASDTLIGSAPAAWLDAGQCTTRSVTANAGSVAGEFRLGAIADRTSSEAELVESNNSRAGDAIGIGLGADLTIRSVIAPASAPANEPFEVTVEVCNDGTLGAASTVELFLSYDDVIGASDSSIGSTSTGWIAPNACVTAAALAVGSAVDGAYQVGGIVDGSNSVSELRETNNRDAGSRIGIGSGPDFVVSAIVGPPSARPGDPFDVAMTICNRGTSGGEVDAELFLSPDVAITIQDSWIGFDGFAWIDAGDCATHSVPSSASVGDGAYRLRASVDRWRLVPELIENNNSLLGGSIGIGNGPDFIVTELSGPASAPAGEPFDVSLTVCNQGTEPGASDVMLVLASEGAISGTDPMISGDAFSSLEPGACTALTLPSTAWVTPGTYRLAAIADVFGSVTELLETNNATDAGPISIDDNQCPDDPLKSAPGQCGCGVADIDADGDGTADCNNQCPSDAAKTAPGQCGCAAADTDSDGDGTANCNNQCPSHAAKTAPGQCGCAVADIDADADGTANCNDQCPSDAAKTAPGQCGCAVADIDADADGTADCNNQCPSDAAKTAPGQCGCAVADTDSDGDGTPNCNDQCPDHAPKTAPGFCGCAVADADVNANGIPDCLDCSDADGDGACDAHDGCPADSGKIAPGQCGCGAADTDSDGDGTANCNDQCPADPAKTAPGQCGCAVADTDSDGDGTANCNDQCPADPAKLAPGVCGCAVADTDSDGDGTPNCIDQCAADPAKLAPGVCGCAVADTDSDGDGTPNCIDQCPADPAKTAPGQCGCAVADTDSDGDGTANCNDQCPADPAKTAPGQCGCAVADTDSDGDGTANCNDQCPSHAAKTAPGQCGCAVADTDSDADGTANCNDQCPADPAKLAPGVCGCGTPDVDSDGNGLMNCQELFSEDFSSAASLSRFTVNATTEYSALAVAGGLLQLTPSPNNAWYANGDGPALRINGVAPAGDFVFAVSVNPHRVGNTAARPNAAYNVGGLMVQSTTDPADWVFAAGGMGGNAAIYVETKNTVNFNTVITDNTTARWQGELRICRIGSVFRIYRRMNGDTGFVLINTYTRADLAGPNIRLALAANGYTPSPDLRADYDWARVATVTSLAQCTAPLGP